MSWLERFIRWLTGDQPQPDALQPDAPQAGPAPDPDSAPARETEAAKDTGTSDGPLAPASPPPIPTQGIIQSRVIGGEGAILQLRRDEKLLAQGKLGRGGTFRLRSLDPGVYIIQILREGEEMPGVISSPVTVTGADPVQVHLSMPGAEPVPVSAPIPVPMPIPAPTPNLGSGRLFDRYVLFGPPSHSATRIHLLLLTEKLAAQAIPFGFRAEEAAHAAQVTIIGGEDGVSAQAAAGLVAQGVTVRRVAGDAGAIRGAV